MGRATQRMYFTGRRYCAICKHEPLSDLEGPVHVRNFSSIFTALNFFNIYKEDV